MSDCINITISETPQFYPITLAIGPPGPTGPQGPSGASGLYGVVTTDSNIPVDQLFTIVNASGPTVQTLPLISSVLSGNETMVFVIYNVNGHSVAVIGSGSDQVQFGSSLLVPFAKESVSLLATSELGWIII